MESCCIWGRRHRHLVHSHRRLVGFSHHLTQRVHVPAAKNDTRKCNNRRSRICCTYEDPHQETTTSFILWFCETFIQNIIDNVNLARTSHAGIWVRNPKWYKIMSEIKFVPLINYHIIAYHRQNIMAVFMLNVCCHFIF